MLTLKSPPAGKPEERPLPVTLKRLSRRAKRAARAAARPAKPVVSEIIQVFHGEALLGQLCLDDTDRVLKCDRAVPRDVAFKILVLATRRHQLTGELTGRDGQVYSWDVVDEDELSDIRDL
jgi:hypothetical protein